MAPARCGPSPWKSPPAPAPSPCRRSAGRPQGALGQRAGACRCDRTHREDRSYRRRYRRRKDRCDGHRPAYRIGQTFSGKAEIKNIPIDKLGEYWPLEFAEGGRAWALANLSSGSLDIGTEFSLSTPGNDLSQLRVDRNVAYLAYRGMTVHYMPHMPELLNVSGKARFEGGTMRFDIAHGNAVGLAVTGATIDLTGLDGLASQNASLRVPIKGSAPAFEALLARPKLGLPRDALYDSKRLGGNAAIELTLSFPLLNDLTVSDIDIKADAAVSAFSLKNAIGNVDLTDGVGRLVYANSQLNVTGVGKFDGNAVDVVWREQFAPRSPFASATSSRARFPRA